MADGGATPAAPQRGMPSLQELLLVLTVAKAAVAGGGRWPAGALRPELLRVNGGAAGAESIVEAAAPALRFAWRVGCGCDDDRAPLCCRGARAGAYQLKVLAAGGDEKAVLFDSGRVASAATAHSVDAGLAPLKPDARYRWSVTLFSEEDGTDASGATAHGSFQTALRSALDWKDAAWIAGFTQARAPFTVREDSAIASATAYASGLGCFELTLNGKPVADSMMDPGWSTIPPMRLLYRAYNVTSLLASGANAAGVRLGFCHYGYIDQAFCVDGHAMRDTCRGFVMRLSIVYANGKTQDVLTTVDGSGGAAWQGTTAANPMVYSHLYHGEVFDARLVQAGWDEPGFEEASAAKGWGAVKAYNTTTAYEGPTQPGLAMSLHEMPTMGVGESRSAVNITEVELPVIHGRAIISAGVLAPVPGGYYSGKHVNPTPAADEAACKAMCLAQTGGALSAPPAPRPTPPCPGGWWEGSKWSPAHPGTGGSGTCNQICPANSQPRDNRTGRCLCGGLNQCNDHHACNYTAGHCSDADEHAYKDVSATCVQATWSSTATDTMVEIDGGYFTNEGAIRPSNATSESDCKQACLASTDCVQIMWTPPRAQERCDLYDTATTATFISNVAVHGW